MLVKAFVDKRSEQLINIMQGFWHENLSYGELETFLWDTLDEWSEIENTQSQLYTHKERIFWHVFHETQFVSAATLQNDNVLKNQIAFCLEFLHTEKACPLDVVGMRP